MVNITLVNGPCPSSVVGLSFYAISYAAVFNQPMRAYDLAKLAVDLTQRFPTNTVRCKVFFLFSIVNYWKMPISDNFHYLYASLQAAQLCGDYLYKAYQRRNIQETLAEERVLIKQLAKTELSDMMLIFGINLGYSSLLSGLTLSEDSYSTFDGTVNECNYSREKNNFPVVELWYTGSKVESLYMFGFLPEAIERGEYFLTLLGAMKGHMHESRGVAYYCLALLASRPTKCEGGLMSKDTEGENERVIAVVNDMYQHLQVWVDHSPFNFAHYHSLIQGEIARVQGKIQSALSFYDRAEQEARRYSYFYIKALANELIARCTNDVGMVCIAETACKKAMKGYKAWGAVQKVKQLLRQFSHMFTDASPLGSSVELQRPDNYPAMTEESISTKLDMRTIIKANHVLSQQLALPQLIQKFTSIVLENVGAEQAAIILVDKSASHSWRVASSWNVKEEHQDGKSNKGSSHTFQPLSSPGSSSSVHMIGTRKHLVNYVMHTKTALAIESFDKSEFYDPLQTLLIGSVLCVPIELKGNLCGVVYLEHSAPKVLQADRLELMSLLCTQLYISIENANLYDSVQSSAHRYKILTEGLPIMAFSRESKGSTFANSKLLQFLGFPSLSAEALSLEQVIANIHKDDLRCFMSAWNHAVDPSRPPVEVEMRMRRAADSNFRWTLCHVSVSFDSHNHAEMLLATWMDIQDLKNAQAEQMEKAAIEVSERKYRSLAEAIPQIVWTSNAEGEINYFNTRWYEFTGLSEAESLGSNYTNAFHPADLGSWPSICDIKSHFEIKLRIKNKDGVYRWHLARAIYLPLNSGGKRFGSFTDIEDQVRTEMSLTQAREAADKAAHNQAFFVANMSHEIRTPMNGLVGMLHLLLQTDLNEEQKDYGETMQRSADSLLRIIDDVLDFSKIQEGKLELRNDELHVESILEGVTETLSVLAIDSELMFYVPPDVPAKLIGDSGKLRQVFMNLIGNSVKFTPKGEVFTSCSVDRRTDTEVFLKFKVQDTGEGISKEKQKQLFTPFYQADATSTRTHGGTGLGLAICRQLVTLFGGEISVDSTLGKGATFSFTARFKIAPDQPTPEMPFFSSSWRYLIVSNLPHSRQILESHLRTCKLSFTSTSSIQEAVIAVQKQDENKEDAYRCVIIDLRQSSDEVLNPKPILSLVGQQRVMLVVNSLQRSILFREYPSASFLLKPITFPKFVVSLHGRCESTEKKLTDKVCGYAPSARVLIVEDNKVNQKVIAMYLKKEQVQFSIANNGLEAFQMVKEMPFGYFSLILLDLAMPVWDGYKACAEIRALENDRFRHPIVALTANVQDGIIDDCKAFGMDDVISKPVDFKNLSRFMQVYLPKL